MMRNVITMGKMEMGNLRMLKKERAVNATLASSTPPVRMNVAKVARVTWIDCGFVNTTNMMEMIDVGK